MKFMKLFLAAAGLLVLGSVAFAAGGAEKNKAKWPAKEITFVYHSNAGSGGDIMLRNLGRAVEKQLGKPIIVDNRTGAAGLTAWDYVKKAKPDGYTFLGISSTFITSTVVNNMRIVPEDYEPICNMFVDPLIIYCRPDAWNSFDDFVADVKKNPGKYKIAGGTPGSIDFTVLRMFSKATGLKVTEVPFDGGMEATVAVAGKHLDIGIGEYIDVASMVEAKKLKVLIGFNKVFGTEVKTLQDYGYDLNIEKFRGILAPKGTPKEIVAVMYEAIQKAFQDPDFIKYYRTNQLQTALKSPEEQMKMMQAQREQVKAEL